MITIPIFDTNQMLWNCVNQGSHRLFFWVISVDQILFFSFFISRSTLKKVQELHDAESEELTKQKKDLEVENEEVKHRLAKLDMNLTQLQCENKVTKSWTW